MAEFPGDRGGDDQPRSVTEGDAARQAAVGQSAGSRLLDVAAAVLTLSLLSPLLLVRAALAVLRERRLFDTVECVGRHRTPFRRLRFAGDFWLSSLAVWVNVLRGEMAVVGPRPLSMDESRSVPDLAGARFGVSPGLISPYAVRRQVGIAHESEYSIDAEYARQRSLPNDLGLIARWSLARMIGGDGKPRSIPETLSFFGIPMSNTTMPNAIDWIIASSAPGEPGQQVAFVNPDCLNIAWRDAAYKRVLCGADRVFPDGIGIRIGGQMLGWGLRDNVNGTDMFPLLCEAAAESGRSLFLLGARPGIAAAAADAMQTRFPRLEIAGTRDGYFSGDDETQVIQSINASGASILLVAFGAPRQEMWIARHRASLTVPIAMGVGGLFDFYSGRIPRAPVWMREMGLEWVFRLMQEPGRMWRRYVIGNPLFLFRVWRQAKHPERFKLPEGAERRALAVPLESPNT